MLEGAEVHPVKTRPVGTEAVEAATWCIKPSRCWADRANNSGSRLAVPTVSTVFAVLQVLLAHLRVDFRAFFLSETSPQMGETNLSLGPISKILFFVL